jgi:hypothetical protein
VPAVLVVLHASAALFLAGMIWTVQVVHYPLFRLVAPAGFAAYEAAHTTRITALLAVPWGLQGLTTGALLLVTPPGVPRWLVWLGAAFAAVPVVVTLVASVPAHRRLAAGFDGAAHRRLVATNWLRTAAWTAHAGVAVAILVGDLGAP